jgi:NMD protein affecting ribosome stability and mRNA decay
VRRQRSKTHPAASQPRIDRRIDEHENDAYGIKGKLPDPTACPSCGATYRNGRWTWSPAPADARRTRCPACRRIEDRYPAGIVTLGGSFAAEHAGEIEGLARNLEEREKQEHPLKRIMEIRPEGDGVVVTTTDARLARAIGEALHHAYQGELDYRFTDAENVLRVSWTR